MCSSLHDSHADHERMRPWRTANASKSVPNAFATGNCGMLGGISVANRGHGVAHSIQYRMKLRSCGGSAPPVREPLGGRGNSLEVGCRVAAAKATWGGAVQEAAPEGRGWEAETSLVSGKLRLCA